MSDIASLYKNGDYLCFLVEIQVKCTLCKCSVPPIGRCTKHLTSQRWILPCNHVINVWEEMKSLFN